MKSCRKQFVWGERIDDVKFHGFIFVQQALQHSKCQFCDNLVSASSQMAKNVFFKKVTDFKSFRMERKGHLSAAAALSLSAQKKTFFGPENRLPPLEPTM